MSSRKRFVAQKTDTSLLKRIASQVLTNDATAPTGCAWHLPILNIEWLATLSDYEFSNCASFYSPIHQALINLVCEKVIKADISNNNDIMNKPIKEEEYKLAFLNGIADELFVRNLSTQKQQQSVNDIYKSKNELEASVHFHKCITMAKPEDLNKDEEDYLNADQENDEKKQRHHYDFLNKIIACDNHGLFTISPSALSNMMETTSTSATKSNSKKTFSRIEMITLFKSLLEDIILNESWQLELKYATNESTRSTVLDNDNENSQGKNKNSSSLDIEEAMKEPSVLSKSFLTGKSNAQHLWYSSLTSIIMYRFYIQLSLACSYQQEKQQQQQQQQQQLSINQVITPWTSINNGNSFNAVTFQNWWLKLTSENRSKLLNMIISTKNKNKNDKHRLIKWLMFRFESFGIKSFQNTNNNYDEGGKELTFNVDIFEEKNAISIASVIFEVLCLFPLSSYAAISNSIMKKTSSSLTNTFNDDGKEVFMLSCSNYLKPFEFDEIFALIQHEWSIWNALTLIEEFDQDKKETSIKNKNKNNTSNDSKTKKLKKKQKRRDRNNTSSKKQLVNNDNDDIEEEDKENEDNDEDNEKIIDENVINITKPSSSLLVEETHSHHSIDQIYEVEEEKSTDILMDISHVVNSVMNEILIKVSESQIMKEKVIEEEVEGGTQDSNALDKAEADEEEEEETQQQQQQQQQQVSEKVSEQVSEDRVEDIEVEVAEVEDVEVEKVEVEVEDVEVEDVRVEVAEVEVAVIDEVRSNYRQGNLSINEELNIHYENNESYFDDNSEDDDDEDDDEEDDDEVVVEEEICEGVKVMKEEQVVINSMGGISQISMQQGMLVHNEKSNHFAPDPHAYHQQSQQHSYHGNSMNDPTPALDLIAWDAWQLRLDHLSDDIVEMAAMLKTVADRRRPWQGGALSRVTDLAVSMWPQAKIHVFGSYESGLAIPSSDIDLVITGVPSYSRLAPIKGTNNIEKGLEKGTLPPLEALARELKRTDWVSSVIALPKTTVPIIKLQTASVPTSFGAMAVISMDISFIFNDNNEYSSSIIPSTPTLSQQHQHHQQQQMSLNQHSTLQQSPYSHHQCNNDSNNTLNNNFIRFSQSIQQQHSGIENTRFVSRLCALHPPLAALVLVLKQLLHEKGLNDPFKGGLGAYGLTVMAAAVCQRHALQPPPEKPSIGMLFVSFLETYGTRGLDPRRSCISLAPAGPLLPLSLHHFNTPRVGSVGFWQPAPPVVIVDPLHPALNVGSSCFGFRQVQLCFDESLRTLLNCPMMEVPQSLKMGSLTSSFTSSESSSDSSPMNHSTSLTSNNNTLTSTTPKTVSILGAIFGAHHHKAVVNLSASVWCPLEKETIMVSPTLTTIHRKKFKENEDDDGKCNNFVAHNNFEVKIDQQVGKCVKEEEEEVLSPPSSFVSSLSVKELEELTSLLGRATPLSNIETLRVQNLMKQTNAVSKISTINSNQSTMSISKSNQSNDSAPMLTSDIDKSSSSFDIDSLCTDDLKQKCLKCINQTNDREKLLEIAKKLLM